MMMMMMREEEDEEFDTTTTSSTSSVSPSTVKSTTLATTPTMKTATTTSAVKTTMKVPHVPVLHFTPIPVFSTPSADFLNEEDVANRDVEEDAANKDVEDVTHGDGNIVTSKVEDHSLDYSLDYFLEKVFNITKPYEDQYSGYVSLSYLILL